MAAEDAESKGGRSLMDYVHEKRRAECPVCRLPDVIREQMATASDRKIKRSVVLAWLSDEHKIGLSDADLTSHYSGHHDSRRAV